MGRVLSICAGQQKIFAENTLLIRLIIILIIVKQSMKNFLAIILLLVVFASACESRWRPRPRPPKPKPTDAPTGAPTSDEPETEAPTVAPTTEEPETESPTEEPGSRTIREQVLDMIQEGVDWNGSVLGLYNTCWWSSYSQYFALNCGDEAESYYEEFDYNEDWKVVVTSGAPDHAAEDQSTPFCTAFRDICQAIKPLIDGGRLNPNRRCEKWQYVVLPKNPELTGVLGDTPMGTTGFATSGGHIYNHLSHPDGSVAWYHEIQSLDLSMGHSDPSATYHYHGVPYLIPDASDSSKCKPIGYLFDGFPVHGQCQDDDGNEILSCWKLTDGASGENVSDYEYDEEGFEAGTCGLDRANGKMFDHGYGYVTTTNFPGIPMFYSGSAIPGSCGFCPEERGFC